MYNSQSSTERNRTIDISRLEQIDRYYKEKEEAPPGPNDLFAVNANPRRDDGSTAYNRCGAVRRRMTDVTPELAVQVKAEICTSDDTLKVIAERFNISTTMISFINNGIKFADVRPYTRKQIRLAAKNKKVLS